MPRGAPTNAQLAAALHEYAALLELTGGESYAARAYRRGADLIATTPILVADLVRSGRARELRGVGPGIEARLRELVETGKLSEVEELRREASPELAALGRLLGFGAQRGVQIGAALGIHTADELRAAAAAGRLRDVAGIGPRTEARIRAALGRQRSEPARAMRLDQALALSERIAEGLGGVPAGDPRRYRDAPTRLAVVLPTQDPDDARARFAAHPDIVALLEPDLGMTTDGFPIELHSAPPERLGTVLVQATGSSEYVASLGTLPEAPDEDGVFRLLGLVYAPPELRELPAAAAPDDLLSLERIRGDLHCHTNASDGRASVREMAAAARALGYEYLAICDHTRAVSIVPGLDADDLRRQADEIAAVNEELAPFRVLRGIECDIVGDGALDLPDEILAELDWVQLSLHAGQRAPREELTARVLHAMQHPAVRCLSHPTGRLIGHARRTRSISSAPTRQLSKPVSRSRSTGCPPDSTSAASTSARRSPPVCESPAQRMPTRCAASTTCRSPSTQHDAAARPRATSSTPSP
jgi:DNA polymerase (family X)